MSQAAAEKKAKTSKSITRTGGCCEHPPEPSQTTHLNWQVKMSVSTHSSTPDLVLREERVYEIDKTSPGAYRPLVVAITSKTSAQRLMAQLAEERGLQDQGRYRMFAFTHPTLPGLERSR